MVNSDIKRKDIPKTNKELNELFTIVVNKIKFINENYSKIENSNHLQDLQKAYEEIYGKKDPNGNITKKGKLEELKEAYNEILVDDEDSEKYSLKSQIKSLLEDIDNDKKKINDFILKVEGEYGEEEGKKVKIKEGLFEKINNQIKKFDNLYEEIDTRLKDGSTSVELAGIFAKKVREYKNLERGWSISFICIVAFFLYYYTTLGEESIKTITDFYSYLLTRLPFFIFSIWLLIFILNRRAEAKKLEESYKHKEVMAWAYVGYKKSIVELDTDDNILLEKHMENLLNAMSVDSSKFLSSKGENHPFIDLFKNILKKDVKGIFPEGVEFSSFGGKITLTKK